MDRLANVLATILETIWTTLTTLNAVAWTEVVRQIIPISMIFGWLTLDKDQAIQLTACISAICAVFARGATVASGRVDQKAAELVAHREMVGTTGTGAGLPPPRNGTNGAH